MANHITELNVSSFRGIKNLALKNLSDINIIVGENNSGKTSLLEAVQLFLDPTEERLVMLSQKREAFYVGSMARTSIIDSLVYLFNFTKDEKDDLIRLSGTFRNENIDIKIVGYVEHEIFSADDFNERLFRKDVYEELQKELIETFVGAIDRNGIKETIHLNSFTVIRRQLGTKLQNFIVTLMPFEHVVSNVLGDITRSKAMIKEAVALLQKFDPKITDIRYKEYESKFTHSKLIPVLEVNEQILVPLSAYGDGMKKCLVLLNKLLMAENGVLLIDEFETALHTSLMQEVFHFLVTVAQELNIQLFMTTHSLEAVDKLLEASQEHLDKVRVIRLANREDKTYAGIIDGHKAYKSRTVYGMELRG